MCSVCRSIVCVFIVTSRILPYGLLVIMIDVSCYYYYDVTTNVVFVIVISVLHHYVKWYYYVYPRTDPRSVYIVFKVWNRIRDRMAVREGAEGVGRGPRGGRCGRAETGRGGRAHLVVIVQ